MKRVLVALSCGLVLLTGSFVLAESADAATGARVTRWVDGDTVVTTHGRVRLIGIDTPEVGRCGAARATRHAAHLAPAGSRILLVNPRSVKDHDRYGRKLRYVQTSSGVDVGFSQIKVGARARYDSLDGYQHHPRQTSYRTTDRKHRNYHCTRTSTPKSTTSLRAYPPANTWNCPAAAPIKGNQSSMIYHMPGQQFYSRTTPEQCFATRAAAEHAGYRASKI
jgi:endonuclease YncB( thermonuclease family)